MGCQPVKMQQPSSENPQVGGEWIFGIPLQTERTEAAGAAVNGKIYVVGGFQKGLSTIDKVEVFDPETGQWTFGKNLPIALDHTAAVSLNNKLYVIGGYKPGWEESNRVLAYDPQTDLWEELAPLPTKRGALTAQTIGGKIYAVGGKGNCLFLHCSIHRDAFEVSLFDGATLKACLNRLGK